MTVLPPATPASLRARVFLPVFVLACVVSLAYVFARSPVYVSVARVRIEAAPGQPPGEDSDATPRLLSAAQALTSSAVLEGVWRQLGGSGTSGAEVLRGTLSAVPVAGTNVIELRAEGSNREVLPQTLNAWIETYRQSQTDAFDRSSTAALDEAQSTTERLKRDIADKRQELEQFRKKFDIVSQERDENQATARLRGLNAAMNEARNREVNAEARLSAMRENIAARRPAAGSADRGIVVELEKRASDLREKMKDLEQEFTDRYLAAEPRYKALRLNLTRLEEQIEQEKRSSTGQALQKAEEEVASARETVARLQGELSTGQREVQKFTARFSEHTAMANELARLEESHESARERLAELDRERKAKGPRLSVLNQPMVPDRPDRPDYWRDAAIGVGGAGALGFLAVWFVEFFRRSGVPRPEPVVQPVIHISYPPGIMVAPGAAALPEASIPILGATATRLPETITQLPRELSGPEVRALWAAAMPDARVVIAGLLGGLSLEELAALRYEHVDLDACYVRVPDISTRSCTLRDPLRRLLIERHAAKGREAPLTGARGEPLSGADLEGLITCAACDAGLANAEEVTSETLRHTYFAYLIRQGARLAEIGEFIGRVPPAAFRDYGRLSPPGPGLPLEEVDPVFPALRAPLA
jgi:uncharacterized protein involved in exopolysaccharide biosynthesis